MRVAQKISLSVLRQSPTRLWLLRIGVAILASVLLVAVWHPQWLNAQDALPAAASTAPVARANPQPPATRLAPLKKRVAAKPLTVKDTASATHRVKAGETLWSIATRYYGDGHQWRVVARRNGIEMTGESALRAGAELVIPSPRYVASAASALPAPLDTTATPKAALAPALPALPKADAPKPTADAAKAGGSLTAQTAGKGNAATPPITTSGAAGKREANAPRVAIAANATVAEDTSELTTMVRLRPVIKAERLLTRGAARIGLVDNDELRASRKAREQSTIFLLQPGSESAAGESAASYHAPVAPRRGEYASAPFPVDEARWQSAGRVQRRVDDAGPSRSGDARMQLADEVIIAPPSGVKLSVGDQLVAVKRAGATANGTPVAFPTGVLEVVAVGDGRLVRAFVRSESGVIEQGQALFPVEGNAAPVGQALVSAPSGDVQTTVSWIETTSVMPTLQSFVLLAAGEAQGVKAGDLFSLVRRADSSKQERLAVVRVVRVARNGSAAIIIKHDAVGVDLGLTALRVSRAP